MEVATDRRRLSLFDAICIMVGIVVGSGIFKTPADVASQSQSAGEFISLWIVGGLASLLGAVCFAELSTRYPEDGGTFAFVRRAFGTQAGFLFAWTDFWIVRPSNVGAVALVLGDYAQAACPIEPRGTLIYALAAVLVTTAIHMWGVEAGRWTQNAMSLVKLVGLMVVVIAAIGLTAPTPGATSSATMESSFAMRWIKGFVFVMFCYGGWSDLSNVAAEVRNPTRNLLRALVLGVAAIMAVYLAVTCAGLISLGLAGLAQTPAFAARIIDLRLVAAGIATPGVGEKAIGLLVAIACLSSLSGVVFTGARVYFALGQQHRWLAWLGQWNYKVGTPLQSLLAQGTISCALLCMAARESDGFERLVILAAPCYWGFIALACAALLVLRRRDCVSPVPFATPLYPWLPLLFLLLCSGLVLSSTVYAFSHWSMESVYSLVVVGIGLLCAVKWSH